MRCRKPPRTGCFCNRVLPGNAAIVSAIAINFTESVSFSMRRHQPTEPPAVRWTADSGFAGPFPETGPSHPRKTLDLPATRYSASAWNRPPSERHTAVKSPSFAIPAAIIRTICRTSRLGATGFSGVASAWIDPRESLSCRTRRLQVADRLVPSGPPSGWRRNVFGAAPNRFLMALERWKLLE